MRLILCVVALLTSSTCAMAQGSRFDSASTTTSPTCAPGATCPVLAIPGTSVTVCTGAQASLAACLQNRATTYNSYTAANACPGTAQLTPAGGGACTPTVDNRGKFGFWVGSSGTYSYVLSLPNNGGTQGPYIITLGGGGGSGAVDSVTGSGAGISVTPTTGAVVVSNTGVTAINTSQTGNVTNVAITSTPNTFTALQTFLGTGATTTGIIALNDNGSTATGVGIFESASRIANWYANPTFAFDVVNTSGVNVFTVSHAGVPRFPLISTGTSGGTQACFDGSFNLSSGTCGGGAPSGAAGGSLKQTYPNPSLSTVIDPVADSSCNVPLAGAASTTSTNITNCFTVYPTGTLVFPAGQYNLQCVSQPGFSAGAFSGRVVFSPGAIFSCNTLSSSSGDIAYFNGGTNTVVDGFVGRFVTSTPQTRANASGLGLHFQNMTNLKLLNTQVLISSGTCLMIETSTNVQVDNTNVQNCSANGLFIKSDNGFQISNTSSNVTFDNAIEVTDYVGIPTFIGTSTITNSHLLNSTASGIAIVGASHVLVSNTYVNGTCSDGVSVFTDSFFGSATPTDVRFVGGTVIGAGTYSNVLSGSCVQTGNGISAEGVGDAYFDDFAITTSTNYAAFVSQAGSITLHNIRAYGANVKGINILTSTEAITDGLDLNGGTGFISAAGNGSLYLHNVKTHNVNVGNANTLFRAIDIENNTSVTGSDISIEDTTTACSGGPCGYLFLGINSTDAPSPIGITFNVPNAPTCTMATVPTSYAPCVSVDGTFTINPAPGISGFANSTLSNLSGTTNINSTLLPQTGLALGSTAKPWHDLFLYGGGTYGSNYTALHSLQASNQTWSIPDTSGSNDTFVGVSLAQTLFNKTFIAPALGTIVSGDIHNASNIVTTSIASGQGTGTKFQLSTGSTTTGHVAVFDATGNTIDNGAAIGLTVTVVGSLPVTCTVGQTMAVTDASSPTYLGTLTGGSTTYTPVTCKGSNIWVSY